MSWSKTGQNGWNVPCNNGVIMGYNRTVLLLLAVFFTVAVLFSVIVSADTAQCYQYSSSTTCTAKNCNWKTSGSNSWCQEWSCFDADGTNQSYCVNLNTTYNLSFGCAWTSGSSLCDPVAGNFLGDSCSDFTTATSCYNSFFCAWNSTSNTCGNPAGGFTGGFGGGGSTGNPSCGVVTNAVTCTNISGCSWDGTACSGNTQGISCGDLNKSICADVTFLSSCCSWNGTKCTTSFVQECYNNVPALPSGASFCEDTAAFKNKTLCEQIAGSPWYMPCIFNQSGKNECHFNSGAYGSGAAGGFSSFDEIGTELGCEAQGGLWKTEQYTAGGVTKTDSWCEFKFGSEFGGGNCDASCWACENGVTSSNAKTTCTNSALGYCSFTSDANAPNGIGWCNPKPQFIAGGAKDVNDVCSAADFLNSPESACVASVKGCVWVNDSSAPNGVGNCYGKNEKRCANDCFSCYTSSDCTGTGEGGNGACVFDSVGLFCKPAGFTGEVCFDGKDNDNDNKIDCTDPDCSTDKFCGGADLSASFGNCPGFTPQGNVTCINNGCVWVKDDFATNFGGASAGFCEFPGAQCGLLDTQVPCAATSGCSWNNAGGNFCGENKTLFDACFPVNNQSGCTNIAGCGWSSDSFNTNGGRCEPLAFSQCFGNATRHANQSNCEANVSIAGQSTKVCGWTVDQYSFQGGGFCNPVCFGLTEANCVDSNTHGLCELKGGYCEPTSFGGKCPTADGNITQCNVDLNTTCTYFTDALANNGRNGSSGNVSGWCNPKGEAGFVNFMGNIEPTIIGIDDNEAAVNDSWDIQGIGLRDDFDRVVFGVRLNDNLEKSGICKGIPTVSGTLGTSTGNHTFLWYIDADKNTTNHCATRDNASLTGFEFLFKYQGQYGASLTETKVAYQCVNGSWAAVPIPLTSEQNKMCGIIGGGMAGIGKTELQKFKTLYNKSVDLRVYTTVSNITTNDSVVVDIAGPFFYSPGAIDFKFEDCATPGSDADGDGLTSSNDPDCFTFQKFGFVPNEIGFQCKDGKDNDADGKTDCDDLGCSFGLECGGSGIPAADTTDKTAPKIVWLQVNTFPDSAFVQYDTDEPANGTLAFYGNDSKCKTKNGTTVRDNGVYDNSLTPYKMWHDGPIDSFSFNHESNGNFSLGNGTIYYYKTTVCDVNNNCAISACLNFTTKASVSSCKSCSSTFSFPFTPFSGLSATNPVGNLQFQIVTPGGVVVNLSANGDTGSQLNYTQTKNFNLVINNPNATGAGANWSITLINASVNGKLSGGITNFSGAKGGDISFNSTSTGTFIGLGDTKCQELINALRPKKIKLSIPGNITELWQTASGLTNAVNKTANATLVGYNATTNVTNWMVSAEWGC